MPATVQDTVMDPGTGRLPSPSHDRALSERQFQRIARVARERGILLSLWNDKGGLVAIDADASPFWKALCGLENSPRGGAFIGALSACVQRVVSNRESSPSPDPYDVVTFEPAPKDVCLVAVPLVQRRGCAGVILAAGVVEGPGGEDFARLCDVLRLDIKALSSMRRQCKSSCNALESTGDLLALAVEQARELDVAQNEMSSLTNNLESTYEELHLIYEISRLMGIPQKPTQMLERVCREMIEVTRAAGIAFVLTRSDGVNATTTRDMRESADADSVVQIGRAAPCVEDVLRIHEAIPQTAKLEADHILYNKAASRSEFAWAASWLRHFVAIPLRLDGELMGVLYSINVIDDGDYNSVDVQLIRAVSDRISAALKNQHLYDDLADLLMGLMYALVNSVDAKDPYTYGHSERVARFSRAIAQAAGLPQIDCERIYLAGLLHDVGKIGVPDAILTKPGKLTASEFDVLKKHPEIGERILSHIRQLRDLLPGVLYHHERMDGRGYPHGLAGDKIPLLGRIICLADSFDAMTSNRTYRAALPITVAAAEIRRCAGTQFDPALAEVFLKIGPQALYDEAQRYSRGDPDIARIGALCSVLSGRPSLAGRAQS